MAPNTNTLFVGADDSNHAGDSRGEIIVAAFSLIPEDSIVMPFPNKRNLEKTTQWFKNPLRDFRFAILTDEKYRRSGQNLVHVVPRLVQEYLDSTGQDPPQLKIYLDGRLEALGRRHIMDFFSTRKNITSVVVDNFIKKNNVKGTTYKRPKCPPLVYHADGLAHHLYRNHTFENLSQDRRLVLL